MCGIVGFYSNKTTISAMDLIIVAYFQRHRGNKDGLGIVDVENNKIFKTTLRLDEIYEGETNSSRYNDDEKGKKRYWDNKLKETIKQLTKWESRCMFLHHRKATAGEICQKNTHPIKSPRKSNILYIHNGSCNEYDTIKKYNGYLEGTKYKTDTDTEVLGNIIEQFKHRELPNRLIIKNLTEIFEKFGVLIRFDMGKKQVEIYKDDGRSLYMFRRPQSKTQTFFMSEPTFIYDYVAIEDISDGYIKICFDEENNAFSTQNTQMTSTLYHNLDKEMWTTALQNSKKINCKEISCDSCRTFKMCITLPDDEYINKDLCPACWVKGLKSILTKVGGQTTNIKRYGGNGNVYNRDYDQDIYDDDGALAQMERWIDQIMTT